MSVRGYDQLSSLELDTLREIGSIGTGNAATALSTLLNREVRITLPEVRFMGYNEAIEWMGGPETVTAGVLVGMGGQMSGIMLAVQHLEFINLVLESMLGDQIEDYTDLDELRQSTLVEVGNIMISTFINALSGLSDISVNLTVPAFGGMSDYIMTIAGHFVCEGKTVPCHLILSPDLRSLNFLLKKLGVAE